ncbi:solute carrier family 52, riboflavin transporter, member 2 isoform X1 [Hoplias malabaricus]|uniref:solute carrier family 52, riboflavin transporter, member 2 isoform X1 n=1 Tax=Hoplias malabaricus TaxID=27720 RepID=UPI003462D3EF
MEDLEDSSFSDLSAMSIATDLKDDFYFRIVNNFLESQTGNHSDLEERPCTNRFMVQVGLMREEHELPWENIIKWLQKIFPKYQATDFHCLIERNTETAMSLTGDARTSFLDSDVNFEFVGPICDSIGIGRTDLLEMSDFSDSAKLTAVTNGLILELTSFIAREKIDPVVLVSWLRNFDPKFCSDGKIYKANKLLQASLKKFRIQYRNSQSSSNWRSGMFEEFLQSPFEFVSDLDETEHKLRRKLPGLSQEGSHFRTPEIKEENEPLDISEHQDASSHLISVKEDCDPVPVRHVPQAQILEEDPRFDTGDCVTLLDHYFLSLQKLAELYGGKNETAKKVSMDLLKNQFSFMLKQDAVMKSLNGKVMAYVLAQADQPLLTPLSFLQCTSQFLFDLIEAIEKQIMSFEREIVSNTGDKLGRDKNPRFRSLVNFDESTVTRYIHMASEILCPTEEMNNTYRRHWLAFCIERKNPSTLPISKSNRFMNYFEAAAGLVHHHKDVALFVSDLQQLNDNSNVILDSVSEDASDEAIQTLVCVVAVVYCKVLGPFWQLLKSNAQYILFSKYIFSLYEKLLEWSQDVSVLLKPEPVTNLFLQFPQQEKNFPGVFIFCKENAENQYGTLLRVCLQRIMKVLAAVIEEDLKEFLPGGKYSREPSEELVKQLESCTFSQMMGEYMFGHGYPYKKRRPDQTQTESNRAEESTRMPTLSPQEKRRESPREVSVGKVHQKPKPYGMFERANMRPIERLRRTRLKLSGQRQKAQKQEQFYKETIQATVAKNGGPCRTVEDVDRLLTRIEGTHHSQQRAALRCELTFQNIILGSKVKKIKYIGSSLADMVAKLKALLPSEQSTASVISEPATNVVNQVNSDPNQITDIAPENQSIDIPQISQEDPIPSSPPSQILSDFIDVVNIDQENIFEGLENSGSDEFFLISP